MILVLALCFVSCLSPIVYFKTCPDKKTTANRVALGDTRLLNNQEYYLPDNRLVVELAA